MSVHLLRTFPNEPIPPYIKAGEGILLRDEFDNTYIDLTGGFTAHAIVGWNHPTVNETIIKQLKKICHIDYKMYSDVNRDELADILINNAKHNLNRVFLCGGAGAEACESAIHLSYQVHYELNKKNKFWYISREQSYHGATSDAMSLGDRQNLAFFKPFFSPYRAKISEHNKYRSKHDAESDDQYCDRCVKELEDKILEIGPENVGGFVAETIMGGLVGDVPPSANYWKKIRKVCDKYDIHLIIDEVWCGTGTTGKFYCIDYDQITPDFIFLGKTLGGGYVPISAILTSSTNEDIIKNTRGRIENSATFQGHSLAVAAAVAVQKIVTEPGFLEEVSIKGEYLREYLKRELAGNIFFNNVRGRGLRNSLEYQCDNQHLFGLMLTAEMKRKHNILINGKWHRICFSPALNIDKEVLDVSLEKFVSEFNLLSEKWKSIDKSKIQLKQFF